MATIPVPLNKATLPNWNRQTDSPKLFNMFIAKDGIANFTPKLNLIAPFLTARAIWETSYDGGSFIVVTNNEIYRVKESGSRTLIAEILNSSQHVEMTENSQNQVTVVDGDFAYVISQRIPPSSPDFFKTLGEAQGFALTNPGSCCSINSFTVILDIDSGIWQISSANNALIYDPDAQILIDPQLEFPLAVRNMNNNLFIFGSSGMERWEPTLNVNIYLFPLQKDMNFKKNFGGISTASIVSNIETIFFLSSRYLPMQVTAQGVVPLPIADGQQEDESGIAKFLSEYTDVKKAIGSFYTLRGNFFYQLTFPDTPDAWVYCINSRTFANVDDYIVGSAFTSEVVITSDGVYRLDIIPDTKKRMVILENIDPYDGAKTFRKVLSAVEARMAQGADNGAYLATDVPEYMALSISLDRRSYSNSVRIPIGNVGQRNARTIWRTNLSGQYFTLKFEYYGAYPLTIEAVYAELN